MVPMRIDNPFDHRDWIFEWKADGFRSLAFVSDGECVLVSRKNNAYKTFDPLRSALGRTPG